MGSRGRAQNKPHPCSSSLFLTHVYGDIYPRITAMDAAGRRCLDGMMPQGHSLVQALVLLPPLDFGLSKALQTENKLLKLEQRITFHSLKDPFKELCLGLRTRRIISI